MGGSEDPHASVSSFAVPKSDGLHGSCVAQATPPGLPPASRPRRGTNASISIHASASQAPPTIDHGVDL